MTTPRRTPGRGGALVAGTAALAASFLLGTVAAGGFAGVTPLPSPSQPTGPPAAPAGPLRPVAAGLTAADSCEELLASYVERGRARVGPYGWELPMYAAMEGSARADDAAGEVAPLPAARGVTEQSSSATGTNVQEAGVDEADTVKTDGRLLVRVRGDDLVVLDVAGARPVELSTTDLPDLTGTGLLLSGRTVVVTGARGPGSRVLVYDLTDPEQPALVSHQALDAALVQAVQHGSVVRLVLSAGLPELDFVQPRFWRDEERARSINREVVAESRVSDWLPRVTTYDAAGRRTDDRSLVDCDQVTVPRSDAALGTVAVLSLDTGEPGEVPAEDAIAVAADTPIAYASPTRLYLAAGDATGWACCTDVVATEPRVVPRTLTPAGDDLGRTRVHAFGLEGSATRYVASGVVDGVVADRWSMDEHEGVLRLAVGPSTRTGNFSSVLTLREAAGRLRVVGRVDRLGVGEEITAVRWFDELAIVVTFRQVDPLYPVDLSDPDHPRLKGELKIPGFSEYLHPIAGQRLLGIGQDASTRGTVRGAQAALFDVSDLTDPRQRDVVRYRRGSVAAAGADPRQFTWLPERDTALTVVNHGNIGTTAWVSVLQVVGDRLANRMVEVEHGLDVTQVRLVPLPDGRVVLVTADEESFLDL